MLRIYHSNSTQRRLFYKRMGTVLTFAVGLATGIWLSNAETGVAIASPLAKFISPSVESSSWCQQDGAEQILQMDCTLSSGKS